MYQCNICGKTFEVKHYLRKHLMETHQIDYDKTRFYFTRIQVRVPIDESEDLSDIEVELTYKE